MKRKAGRYKSGYDPREIGRQLTICFDWIITSTDIKIAVNSLLKAPQCKNYTFFIYPEMLEEVNKLLDMPAGPDILKTGGTHDTAKAVSFESHMPDSFFPDDTVGTNEDEISG